MLVAKEIVVRPSLCSRASSAVFEKAATPSGTIIVVRNVALKSGSSQQGRMRRASVGWHCEVAMGCFAPSSSS